MLVLVVTFLMPAKASPAPVPDSSTPAATAADGVSIDVSLSSERAAVGSPLTITVTVTGCPGVAPVVTVTHEDGDDRSIPLQASGDGRWSGSYVGTQAGRDTIKATVTTPSGRPYSDEAVHDWTPTVVLSPQSQSKVIGENATVAVSLSGVEPSALRVEVKGANPGPLDIAVGESGLTATYTGRVAGPDYIEATIDGWDVRSNQVTVVWTRRDLDLALSASPESVYVGDTVTVTAEVDPPGGVVRFTPPDGDEVTDDSAPYSITRTLREAGTNRFSAVYELDGAEEEASIDVTVREVPDPELTLSGELYDWFVAGVPDADRVWLEIDGAEAADLTLEGSTWSVRHEPESWSEAQAVAVFGDREFPSNVVSASAVDRVSATPASWTTASVPEPVVSSNGTCDLLLEMGPDGQSSTVGDEFSTTVRLTEAGVPLQGWNITFEVASLAGEGSPPSEQVATDENGEAVFAYTRDKPGADSVTAEVTVDGVPLGQSIGHAWDDVPSEVVVDLGPVGITSLVGSSFTTTAVVTDRGTPVEGATVLFEVVMPGQTSLIEEASTDVNGAASYTYIRDVAGSERIVATVAIDGEETTWVIGHTWVDIPGLTFDVVPDQATSMVDTPFTATAVLMQGDRPVTGELISFTVVMTGAPDESGRARTGPDGTASFRWRRAVPGTDQLTATYTAPDGTQVEASLMHTWLDDPPALQVALGPSDVTTVVGSSFTPTAVVTEEDGTPIEGARVRFEAALPGAPSERAVQSTDANGLASYSYTRKQVGTEEVAAVVTHDGHRAQTAIGHTWIDIPGLSFEVTPPRGSSAVNTWYKVTASLRVDNRPARDARIVFETDAAQGAGGAKVQRTGADGTVPFRWRRMLQGVEQLTATYTTPEGQEISDGHVHVWTSKPLPEHEADLTLEDPSVPPGGDVQATGFGCEAVPEVTLSLDGQAVATVTADGTGAYAATLTVPEETSLDDHSVVASCGTVVVERILNVSRPGGETATPMAAIVTTSAVLTFFMLLGGQVLRFTGLASPSSPS